MLAVGGWDAPRYILRPREPQEPDIVQRLREEARFWTWQGSAYHVLRDAADEIERLRAGRARA